MCSVAHKQRNIKLTIAYDGGAYLGWQKTKMGPSIEQSLQDVLETIFQEPIKLQAASRTDAGVHADGQVVNFITERTSPSLDRLHQSLNKLLPNDIAVLTVEEASLSFHPTLDCKGKEYRYTLDYGAVQQPKHRHYAWHYPSQLDLKAMREAADLLTGEHDFAAFCNYRKNQKYAHHIRLIERIEIEQLPNENSLFDLHSRDKNSKFESGIIPSKRLCIKVIGNNFL